MEKNGKKNNFFTTLTPEQMELKKGFIRNYANKINNAADGSQMDANANITNKNIHTMEYEIHKDINIQINRALISDKIRELYGDDLAKEYIRQIESHEIYVHDETSLKPYCVSITMYPFLLDGLKTLGGGSVAPKHLSSFCGGFINLMLAVSSQFAGAVKKLLRNKCSRYKFSSATCCIHHQPTICIKRLSVNFLEHFHI